MAEWRGFARRCRCRAAQLHRRLAAWRRDERGASAVEFALVLPLLLALLLGIIQYGSLFLIQSRMNDTARDTARRLAVGDLPSESDAERFAREQLADWPATFVVKATLPKAPDRDVIVTITVPATDAAMLNIVSFGLEGDMKSEFYMLKE
jgi:Flp pilus assembly pilin Flp